MNDDRFVKGSKLAKLLGGRERPHRKFSLEVVRDNGPETVTFAVRAISAEEQERSHADALKWLTSTGGWSREDLIADAGDAVLNLELMVQMLARALVDPDAPGTPLATDAAQVRAMLDADEVRACFDEYVAFQSERSPFRSLKSWAEVEEVADALGKGQTSPTNLQRYDTVSLRNIITSLAARAAKRTTPNSSDISPRSDSSPASSASSEATTPGVISVSEEPPKS